MKSIPPSNPDRTPSDDIFHSQLERAELRASGVIDERMSEEIAVQLRYLVISKQRRDVTIFMNTTGGSVVDGFAIYDLIKNLQKHHGARITLKIQGACMSMGAVVLQAAHKRVAAPNSAFLLHELHATQHGGLSQLADQHKHAEKLQKRLDAVIQERTRIHPDKLRKLVQRRDTYLTAQEALKYNLIDAIV